MRAATRKPDRSKPILARESSETTITPGATVTDDGGVTIKVPSGTTATYARYELLGDAERARKMPGDLRQSDYLRLEQLPANIGSRAVMVYSSQASRLPQTTLEEFGRQKLTLLASGSGTEIYIGKGDFPIPPRRLFAVQGVGSSGHPVVFFFGGSSTDPTGSVQSVWRGLAVRGLSLPPGF